MSEFNLQHIARLSKLAFKPEELRVFESQVAEILGFVDQLKEINVEGIKPTSHPLDLSNVFRKDEPHTPLAIEEFLKRAPKSRGRFFEVPKIIQDKS